MKELLNHYKCITKQEVYDMLLERYNKGFTFTAQLCFIMMDSVEKEEFIATLSPYDPVYTFFSTMNFAETL